MNLKTVLASLSFVAFASQLTAQGVPSLADGSLAMGEAVAPQAEAQAPQTAGEDITSEIIGDWDLQCAASGPEPRPCRLYQLLKDPAGTPIAEVTLFDLAVPEGEAVAGASVIVPLETLLTSQLTVTVDGENARRYPFAFCNQMGCVARIGLSADDIAKYKGGKAAQLTIVPALAPTQVVNINMSLAGFTKAFGKASGEVAE
ncbi:invasion associated locus B family protein [Shimia marina]|uniref:Invasion protein B, involved in pathogenesis n=1 Tax=Shimia marina TaxID=321267 RepID=A0A0P1ETH9_9RHOB|nr:invasion associated locus B family protein [Shimia marina]CUH53789.1 Invasion protein B, involved in pathogenesis [Shimia marina]SFD68479.1 Invasion protein IalB, involved in pathogenesis [Shimia marina]